MAITVRNVSKSFVDFHALTDVSVDIPSGSLTALLGPSGGGKSTLLRIIAGLEQPDSGVVEIAGEDSTALPPQQRNVGFVFQHYAAFKHLTVRRNVAFGLEIRKRPKDEIRTRVDELLELVHLSQFADRYPSQLSGGQRQRMALARALAVEPEVLLLDEPFGALDAQVRRELRDWLRRLHDEVHVTTVFVTHDQEEAMEVADEIVVINEGRVEQVGTPDELYDKPANDFVMSFLGPVTRLNGTLVRPHDLELFTEEEPNTTPGVVSRVVRLGFEVRVDVAVGDGEVWVQLTRGEAERAEVEVGDKVWLRAARTGRVNVSAKVDYAIRALVALAATDGGPVKAEALATSQDIPLNFLENVLGDLRRAGVVATQRGAAGGYRLARPASSITLADVIRPLDGPLAAVRGVRPESLEYATPTEHLQDVWIAVRASMRSVLESVTLADVASGRLPRHIAKLTESDDAWQAH